MTSRIYGAELSRAVPDVADAPTVGDHRRMRRARSKARAQMRVIEAQRSAALLAAFREEIATVVRSASPLLISLLGTAGLTLDAAMATIEPGDSWPRYPRLSGKLSGKAVHRNLLRYYAFGTQQKRLSAPPLTGKFFLGENGDCLWLQIADHCVDLDAHIGRVIIQTRYGELKIEFIDMLPNVIFDSCIGRPIDTIVDFAAWRGLGWLIVETINATDLNGQILIVAMGTVPYTVIWPSASAPAPSLDSLIAT